jgi:squalene-associated FAD-dependent desaturase
MYDVIIIGAGIAGISAAINLVKAGKKVLVIEQNPNPGGRCYSFFDEPAGEIIDNGQHLMTGAYSNFLSIIEELGTEKNLIMQDNLRIDFIRDDGNNDLLDCSLLPGKAGILLGLIRMRNLTLQSKYAVGKLFLMIKTIDLSKKDMTVEQFLKNEKQTDNSIINFWEPLTLATLNNSVIISSAKLLVTVLKRAFFSGKNDSKLIFPNVPLSDLFSPFAEWMERHGSKVVFQAKINGVKIEDERVLSINSAKNEYKAKDYIFAIPPHNLYNLLDDKIKNVPEFINLNEIKYSPIVSVYIWLDKEFPDIKFAALLGTRSQWVFNRKKILDGFEDHKHQTALTITISNAFSIIDESKESIISICSNELQKLFPAINGAKIIHSKVVKMKYATVLQTPEKILSLPITTTPIKNMYLAGDYIQTGLPATIEGAALSGKIAAEYLSDHK